MSKIMTGNVVAVKMAKTAVVEVESVRAHPLYRKAVRRNKKFHVHDEVGVKSGDRVEFRETRPISKTKRWIITKIVSGEPKKPKVKAKVKKRGRNDPK